MKIVKLTQSGKELQDLINKINPMLEKLTELSEEIASNGVLIEDLQNMKIDKENDDYYPKMAVGLADNLAGVDVVDSEINFRRSGGGAISDGVARIESIKGNSVVWNNQSGSLSVDSVTNSTPLPLGATFVSGHKYLYVCEKNTDSNIYIYYREVGGNNTILANPKNANSFIFSSSVTLTANGKASAEGGIWLFQLALNGATEYGAENIRIYDLTKMFQAGNEPTTIEEFYARIPMGVDLNAYNEGEVIHMDVQSIESVGVNQWDEQWELGYISNGNDITDSNRIRSKNYIRVSPNTEYYVTTLAGIEFNLIMYDANKQYVGTVSKSSSFSHTMPSNVHYVRFAIGASYTPVNTYKEGVCINLFDASINGKYFPYIKRVEDLSLIRKYFPDGMKSAGTAHDEIRNNVATGKRESKDALLAVKMKDLDWKGSTFANYTHAFRAALGIGEASGNNVMCIRFVRKSDTSSSAWITDSNPYTIAYYNGYIGVNDPAYTNVDAFIASLTDNDILYIERAEPIITELDAEDQFRDLDYQVWNGGTEKANAEGKSAPLVADITYGFNAIGKIKELEQAIKALQTTVASL